MYVAVDAVPATRVTPVVDVVATLKFATFEPLQGSAVARILFPMESTMPTFRIPAETVAAAVAPICVRATFDVLGSVTFKGFDKFVCPVERTTRNVFAVVIPLFVSTLPPQLFTAELAVTVPPTCIAPPVTFAQLVRVVVSQTTVGCVVVSR